jgi:hypothetical protein
MYRLGRIAQLVGLNAIPVIGVAAGNWSNATALAVYWCETIILVFLVSVRIHIHRVTTRKRGHFVEKRVKTGKFSSRAGGIGHFGTSFFAFALLMSLFNAIFLSWAIGNERLGAINGTQLKQGVIADTILLVLGLAMDLAVIRKRPFAWIKEMSGAILRRVFLLYFIMIVGAVLAIALDLPRGVLLAFVLLKLWGDISAQIPALRPKPTEEQQKLAAAEEERFSGRPIPFKSALIQRYDG